MLHGSFTVTRDVNAAPARVWDAYANVDLRSAWRRLPGPDGVLELDFRVGGWERLTGTSAATGTVEHIASHALFLDIVPGERIVSAHEALLDGVRRWVSLISIEFAPAPGGTRVTHTEQHTFPPGPATAPTIRRTCGAAPSSPSTPSPRWSSGEAGYRRRARRRRTTRTMKTGITQPKPVPTGPMVTWAT